MTLSSRIPRPIATEGSRMLASKCARKQNNANKIQPKCIYRMCCSIVVSATIPKA